MRRLFRARSPRQLVIAADREIRGRMAARGVDRTLGSLAADSSDRVLVGPFVGEVGFELLYWLPFVRRQLRNRGVSPDRVIVMGRGGSATWYQDIAEESIDLFELMDVAEYLRRLSDRRRRVGDAKQLTIEKLDQELRALATEMVGEAAWLHPITMYHRLRYVWASWEPVHVLERHCTYRPLPVPAASTRWRSSTSPYVAVKAYWSDALPNTEANRLRIARMVEALSEHHEIVVLGSRQRLDEHDEWAPEGGNRVHHLDPAEWPEENLALQTAVVAGAQGLVATYGGFSYLGPLVGVPTLALRSEVAWNPVHLSALRRAIDTTYEVSSVDDTGAALRFVEAHAARDGEH